MSKNFTPIQDIGGKCAVDADCITNTCVSNKCISPPLPPPSPQITCSDPPSCKGFTCDDCPEDSICPPGSEGAGDDTYCCVNFASGKQWKKEVTINPYTGNAWPKRYKKHTKCPNKSMYCCNAEILAYTIILSLTFAVSEGGGEVSEFVMAMVEAIGEGACETGLNALFKNLNIFQGPEAWLGQFLKSFFCVITQDVGDFIKDLFNGEALGILCYKILNCTNCGCLWAPCTGLHPPCTNPPCDTQSCCADGGCGLGAVCW